MIEYRVRTPPSYIVVVGALWGVATIAAIGLAWVVQHGGTAAQVGQAIVVCGVLCVLPIAHWISSAAYRIGGGRNLIRFFADRIEVPGPRARAPIVFRREGLVAKTRAVRVRMRWGAQLNRGTLIELAGSGGARAISTLVLEDPGDARALLADLERFVSGGDAVGRAVHDSAPRTEYDDRLDRELAEM